MCWGEAVCGRARGIRSGNFEPASLPRGARKMRPVDEEDEGIEMGGTLDPEDGLQGLASKVVPMPKW